MNPNPEIEIENGAQPPTSTNVTTNTSNTALSACDGKPPIYGNEDTWRRVLAAAGCRCQCTGQCGKKKHNKPDRCPEENTAARPLHIVATDPGTPFKVACKDSAELVAMCAECRKERDKAYGDAMRAACGMGEPETALMPLFEIEETGMDAGQPTP